MSKISNLIVYFTEILIGIITTVGTTQAFLALMTKHLEVQRKLQQEIDEVVGVRQPRLADRPNMPLMEAVGFHLCCFTSSSNDMKLSFFIYANGCILFKFYCRVQHLQMSVSWDIAQNIIISNQN